MRVVRTRFAISRRVFLVKDCRPLNRFDTSFRRLYFTSDTHARQLPINNGLIRPPYYHRDPPALAEGTTLDFFEERGDTMGGEKSVSTTSSNLKRKRGPLAFYAVKVGRNPDIYYSWEDAKEQTVGFKDSVFKKCNTLGEAEDFMKSGSNAAPKPAKTKYYGVQAGHVPGVYADYSSVLEQVTGFKGSKQKSFSTREEAEAYVNEGKTTPSESHTPISLKGHLGSITPSPEEPRKSSKKPKKNGGSAVVPEVNGDYEPGMGPIPLNAEDGFDNRIKLPDNRNDGKLEFKTEAERNARKRQPTGYFEGTLEIWTDGAAKGNGQIGAAAGIGIWFGPHDPRNVSEPLIGYGKQTNQRAELTAISRAIDIAPIDRDVLIYTDSYYSIKCVTEWFQKWESNEWKNAAGKPVENKDIIEPIIARIREREMARASTKFMWVKGHDTNAGNIGADALATQGARQSQINAQIERVSGNEAAHVLADHAAEQGQAQIYSVLGETPDLQEALEELF